MEEEYLQEISELEERVEELEGELEESEFEASSLQEDNWELEREVSGLEQEVSDLESQLEDVEKSSVPAVLDEYKFGKGNLYNKALVDFDFIGADNERDAFLAGIEYALEYMGEH